MDWQTILTSGVIAAIVAGIIELVKLSNSNKSRYIIQQREKWREKIRKISEEIQTADFNNIGLPITKLKTRINPYGEFVDFPTLKTYNKKLTKKEKKQHLNDESIIEDYYLKDGHIHDVINKLESNEDFDNNKKLLNKYLELLMKFDWERSKTESTISKKRVVSIIFEFFGVSLFIYHSYNSYVKEKFSIEEAIITVAIFTLMYIMPDFMIWIISKSEIIKRLSNKAMTKTYIMVLIWFFISLFFSLLVQNDIVSLAILFMIFALMLSFVSAFDKSCFVKDYISSLEKLSKSSNSVENTDAAPKENNSSEDETINLTDNSQGENKTNNLILFFIYLFKIIVNSLCLLFNFIKHLFNKIVEKERALINKIESKNSKYK